MTSFELVGEIIATETIAQGRGIRELARLIKHYSGSNWKKKKGMGQIRLLPSGEVCQAELHWYEVHGVGKVEIKIKDIL
jgi:hypothetical protein